LVCAGKRSIPAGIVALLIGFASKSVGTSADLADTGLTVEPGRPSVRVASLETRVYYNAAAEEEATQAAATHDVSFNERFASSVDERSTSAFKERFAASFDESRGEAAAETLVFGDPVSPMPLVGALPEPLKSFATPQDANSALVAEAGRHESGPPAVGRTALEPTVARTPLPVKKPDFTAEAGSDSISLSEPGSRTAIYDIAAHIVYLPNGEMLEAHSGLGSDLDNPNNVSIRGRGPTPPNVYGLALREELFHGIRAIRLIPVGEGNMFGREGLLAHPYMLGPNGQSNGCVSFSNYPAFLSAFLRGEVDRLVVVQRLATAPTPRAGPEWLPEPLRSLFFKPS
jgi:Protein of unknown function (DUF2778)